MKSCRLAPLALALLAAAAAAQTQSFALIGDTPYNTGERHLLPKLLEEIGADGAGFVVHIGDIKDGSSPCSDEVFRDRKAVFDASPVPFIFVPGDNEWADCHRTSNGRYDPRERLERLRGLFFATSTSLGRQRLGLERQAGVYREHVRWQAGPVLFVGLNVPGGGNNWGTRAEPSAEFRQRMPQVIAWIEASFARARAENFRAIVLAIQANPGFELFAKGLAHGAYRELLEKLRAETRAFAGEVVLVHGDTHTQRIDHPLRDADTGEAVANFTRVETYGSPFMGWVRGSIDPLATPVLRFEARNFPAPSASLP